MTKFRKTALRVGKYHSPDGIVEVTPDRLRRWEKNFRRMKAARYDVPIDWDHASKIEDMQPVKRRDFKTRSAKNTVGKLSDFSLNAAGDAAVLEFDVTDPTAQGRADRNEVFISPVILDNWKDGAANQYSDVISHVDFVNHPVDHSQEPFAKVEPGAIACAIRMGLSGAYRLADDANPFGGGDDDADEDGESPEVPEESTEEKENPDLPNDEGGDQEAEAIVAHLSQMGVELPAEWTFKTQSAGQILLAALKTANRAKTDVKEDDQAGDPMDGQQDAQAPMQVADPGYAAMSLYADGKHREEVGRKLHALLENGKCLPREYQEKNESTKAVRLSLNAQGQHQQSDLEKWIDSREAVPRGTFWDGTKRTQMMSVPTAVPHPAQVTGGRETEEEAEETVNRIFGVKKK